MTISKVSAKPNIQPSTHSNTPICPEIVIEAVVLALGSNYQATHYFPIARQQLAKLGDMVVSDELVNADFTATIEQPKPDYTNQCVYIKLYQPCTFDDLRQSLKDIEQICHRQHQQIPTNIHTDYPNSTVTYTINGNVKVVSMDIDILAIQFCDEYEQIWQPIIKRMPFKSHEKIGVRQLNQRLDLGFQV